MTRAGGEKEAFALFPANEVARSQVKVLCLIFRDFRKMSVFISRKSTMGNMNEIIYNLHSDAYAYDKEKQYSFSFIFILHRRHNILSYNINLRATFPEIYLKIFSLLPSCSCSFWNKLMSWNCDWLKWNCNKTTYFEIKEIYTLLNLNILCNIVCGDGAVFGSVYVCTLCSFCCCLLQIDVNFMFSFFPSEIHNRIVKLNEYTNNPTHINYTQKIQVVNWCVEYFFCSRFTLEWFGKVVDFQQTGRIIANLSKRGKLQW